MLTNQDKREMLKDAKSVLRRKQFARGKRMIKKNAQSLDDYIRFLTAVQKIIPLKKRQRRITITRFNKL